MNVPAPNPCVSCPYRLDVPSGVWAEEEYRKLPPYDAETGLQPVGVFMCHQQDGRVCAGWAACHDMDENLGLRIAVADDRMTVEVATAICDYTTPVPVFESGAAAATHGLRDLEAPGDDAAAVMRKVTRRRGRP